MVREIAPELCTMKLVSPEVCDTRSYAGPSGGPSFGSKHQTVKVESILLNQTRLLSDGDDGSAVGTPPVVVQTRPMEGCHTAVPRRLRRGPDVRTADDAVAVDTRHVSAVSDTVVSRKIHMKSECGHESYA